MVPVAALWFPILVSAVIVFVASSIVHMALKYHDTDFARLPKEDDVLDALRPLAIPPGDYAAPFAQGAAGMKDPAYLEKMNAGPVVLMTVMPPGPPAMGGALATWFVFILVVSTFAAYVTGRALGPSANYLEVFRFAGTTAFVAYSFGVVPQSIWYKRQWSSTMKSVADGLVYGLLTAGTFGWLWPR